MSKPFILFIIGISTSGKSTLSTILKKNTKDGKIKIIDIDEEGVPLAGRSSWREYRAESLYYDALYRQKEGESTVVCGVVLPHEIVESTLYSPDHNVHFLMLDISLETYRSRIKKRLDESGERSKLKEVQGKYYEEEMFATTVKTRRRLLNSTASQKNGYVLDVSKLTKEQVVQEAVRLIDQISNK